PTATCSSGSLFFLFNSSATSGIYTLSLHDALPICGVVDRHPMGGITLRVDVKRSWTHAVQALVVAEVPRQQIAIGVGVEASGLALDFRGDRSGDLLQRWLQQLPAARS